MLKQLSMTARLNNAGSVNQNLQLSEKKQSPPKTPTTEPESQASVLRTTTTACFFSGFEKLIFNSLSFSKTIASWWSGWSTIAWLASLVIVMLRAKLVTLYLLFWQLSAIGHILTNQVLRCWADGGFAKLKEPSVSPTTEYMIGQYVPDNR